MIRFFLIAAFALTMTSSSLTAQRFCVVDVASILEAMPEYKKAQDDLDKVAQQWRDEVGKEYAAIEEMYRRYQAEEVILSDNQRKERQEAIIEKERQVRELQKARFGPEGALFQRRQELVKPIQESVYNTIERYAEERGFDFILEKSAGAGIIFANPQYDKTQDVLKRLNK